MCTLDRLADLDERIEAHLDGLRLAGVQAWSICAQECAWEDPGEVFVGAVLAFGGLAQERSAELLSRAGQVPAHAAAVTAALSWLGYQTAAPHVRALLGAEAAPLRAIALRVAALHQADLGPSLAAALRDADPQVRATALRSVGELGRVELLAQCRLGLSDDDLDCRRAAARSMALLGDAGGLAVIKQAAEEDRPDAQAYAELAVRRMPPPVAAGWVGQLAKVPERRRLALSLTAAIGDPGLVPWLLECMRGHETARLAGAAFSAITGLAIAGEYSNARPAEFAAMPNDDPADDNVAMDPDEDLAWPQVDQLGRWWSQTQGRFPAGTRWHDGKPVSGQSLLGVLRNGTQPQRAGAALEIALARPERPLFDVTARGDRQLQALDRIA